MYDVGFKIADDVLSEIDYHWIGKRKVFIDQHF